MATRKRLSVSDPVVPILPGEEGFELPPPSPEVATTTAVAEVTSAPIVAEVRSPAPEPVPTPLPAPVNLAATVQSELEAASRVDWTTYIFEVTNLEPDARKVLSAAKSAGVPVAVAQEHLDALKAYRADTTQASTVGELAKAREEASSTMAKAREHAKLVQQALEAKIREADIAASDAYQKWSKARDAEGRVERFKRNYPFLISPEVVSPYQIGAIAHWKAQIDVASRAINQAFLDKDTTARMRAEEKKDFAQRMVSLAEMVQN